MKTNRALRKALYSIITGTILLLACISSGIAQGYNESHAKEFVGLLAKKDFVTARQYFNGQLDTLVTAEKLGAAWEAVIEKVGVFKSQGGVRKESLNGYDFIYVTCQFANTSLDVKLTFDTEGKIAGLFFVPTESSTSSATPTFEKPTSVEEREVTVGSGQWAVHGTLTVPKGKGPFPAIVLVHGSGPGDRDETVGPNKPFRDLAWGLAAKGIAVLRYEKRTREHGAEIASAPDSFTVWQETVEDAVSGAKLLRDTKGIDPKKVYVLGHSLGGMMIPRIGASDTKIAGLVIMAGGTRQLEDVIVEQTAYLLSLKDSITDEDRASVERVRAEALRIKALVPTGETSSDRFFGVPALYWLDLRSYNPTDAAKQLRRPMLILQGGRDYQVTDVDLHNWQTALAGRNDVTFKTYPSLNHLFMEGTGRITPEEYQKPGHIPQTVIDDIAAWIKR